MLARLDGAGNFTWTSSLLISVVCRRVLEFVGRALFENRHRLLLGRFDFGRDLSPM